MSLNGWLYLDKPIGFTSNRILNIIKRNLRKVKMGYVGTLDPLASGFLPIALGKATRVIRYLGNFDKEYIFTVKWGIKTSTADSEGEEIGKTFFLPNFHNIKSSLIQVLKLKFQIPPKFSAKKINGQRAYNLARKGKKFDLSPQKVKIYKLKLIKHNSKFQSTFYVKCSAGTYVRTIAENLAEICGTYGHVCYLRRIGFGKLNKKLISLDSFLSLMHIDTLINELKPVDYIFEGEKKINLDEVEAKKLINGQPINLDNNLKSSNFLDLNLNSRVIAKYKKKLLVVGYIKKNEYYPKTVLDLDD